MCSAHLSLGGKQASKGVACTVLKRREEAQHLASTRTKPGVNKTSTGFKEKQYQLRSSPLYKAGKKEQSQDPECFLLPPPPPPGDAPLRRAEHSPDTWHTSRAGAGSTRSPLLQPQPQKRAVGAKQQPMHTETQRNPCQENVWGSWVAFARSPNPQNLQKCCDSF